MISVFVVLALVFASALILYFYLKSTGGRRAALSATPMGAYLRARDKGATAEQAIFDAIQILRYREPWTTLSDADLSTAAAILATLRDPKLFTSVVVEVEESRSLDSIRNPAGLKGFVISVNSMPAKR
jgi:hypothetical protein